MVTQAMSSVSVIDAHLCHMSSVSVIDDHSGHVLCVSNR